MVRDRSRQHALKVDFSSPSPDPLSSRRPVHANVKDGYKKSLFYRCWVNTIENNKNHKNVISLNITAHGQLVDVMASDITFLW